MDRFKNIESLIEGISTEMGGIISKDRPNYPESMRTFEERRIDWLDDEIRKAIIIQPTFENNGVNSDLWNFRIVAWTKRKRMLFSENLITKKDFGVIELNAEELLKTGKEILQFIKMSDLSQNIMVKDELLDKIKEAWNWTGFIAKEIKNVNLFGNIIFESIKGDYYRICPEELNCEKIANTNSEYISLSNSEEFEEDWNMYELTRIAKQELGELVEDEKYCLKIPAVLGGEYSKDNLGKITLKELISSSGDLAFQIKDLEDGQEIEVKIEN